LLLVTCPYCGARAETEFACGGEAGIVRPLDPDAVGDEAWADYLFMRTNPKGWLRERWRHVHGCGRWFIAWRHTATDRFGATWRYGDPEPPAPEAVA